MQIICKDGTTIPCDDFEATDSGILFFQKKPSQKQSAQEGEEDEEAESDQEEERASGFVPTGELHFVLPDQMVTQQPQRGMEQQAGQMPQGGQPRQPSQHQQTGMAQQQQMQQPQSGQQQPPR